MEEKSLKEIMQEMLDKQKQENVKPKKFKIPFKAKVGKNRAKKGWVTVMKIIDNRHVEFEKLKIDEQTVMSDGIPRIATPEETLFYKCKPLIILPSWSVKPFSPTDNYEGTVSKQYQSQGYRLLINKMKSEAIKPKRSISGAVIFFVILGLIAAGYFITKGGFN